MSHLPTIAEELQPIVWQDGHLLLLDQTQLPAREEWVTVRDVAGAIEAVRAMRVRGAPAIGIAAAYAMALAAHSIEVPTMPAFLGELDAQAERIAAARPTAVNLAWAVERSMGVARTCSTPAEAAERILALAHTMREEDVESNRAIGRNGAALMPDSGAILTHCNTGALATAGYGTALGVIRAAWDSGKRVQVFCTETRPWLQGARLTAWELARLGIHATLIVDSAAGALMASGGVAAVVTGADRIAANGDTANKIGTYSLAELAAANGIPFYIAAPLSTVDLDVKSGADIPVEERPAVEVTSLAGQRIAAEGVDVWNPVFDMTPARLITAIITERGVLRPPYEAQLRAPHPSPLPQEKTVA
ncbi:MAG: S-methyl-5-thioribose-1-phosphate isomerase [Chloroflexota bacterium]|nr:S-methyl-5-thioribose-1-phosphate isomerase [Chloroflexota bacterium]MDE2884227.1 S-methyl-5-thioribose-1-phosphate isomerase [Chloroflexota bacterium]